MAPRSREWGTETHVQVLVLVIQSTLSPGKSSGLSGFQFRFLSNEGVGLVVQEWKSKCKDSKCCSLGGLR